MQQQLVSKVWQIAGTFGGANPGLLILDNGYVSFVTAEGEHFNVPISEVKDVKWPFLQFGYGFNATVNGSTYKFTFMKPNGAAELNESNISQLAGLTRGGRGVDAMFTLANIGKDKKTAKEWKAIVGG